MERSHSHNSGSDAESSLARSGRRRVPCTVTAPKLQDEFPVWMKQAFRVPRLLLVVPGLLGRQGEGDGGCIGSDGEFGIVQRSAFSVQRDRCR